jgi:hypothetical protein
MRTDLAGAESNRDHMSAKLGGADLASVTSPATREAWAACAEHDQSALATLTPTWLDCLRDALPYRDASRLYRFEDGLEVVIPMVSRRGWPTRLIAEESWPHGGMGGALVSGGALHVDQARSIFNDLARRPALRVAVRFSPMSSDAWSDARSAAFRTAEHSSQIIDIEDGYAATWDRFHQRARRAVRRAEHSDVEVQVDRAGRLVPVFEHLYETSIERWASQQHEPLAFARWRRRREDPPTLLRSVAKRFGENCAIWAAFHRGQPAAAIVVLRQGCNAKYWRGAMDRELAHPIRANHLIHNLAIEDACAQGCRYYHMGDSRPGSSLAEFKESFGARTAPSQLYVRERLPLTAADRQLRTIVKRVLRFQDA